MTKNIIVADSLVAYERVNESIHWWVEWWEDRSLHWQCHWSRLTDYMWTYDQIHWWVKRWKQVDHCIENRCHWSRLTSCMWTNRQIDSLIDKAMRRSLHWWCYWSRLTESLLLKIETSRSSMTDLVWLFNKFKEFLANLNEWLIH